MKNGSKLIVIPYILGPYQTNTYLVADDEQKTAVVIDPSFGGGVILADVEKKHWKVESIWITHAHFDHFAGIPELTNGNISTLTVGLHPDDDELWKLKGGAMNFGISVQIQPNPSLQFSHGQKLTVGRFEFTVFSAPGHTKGHVIFYSAEAHLLFSGDVIFQGSVGRTDLPGSLDHATLIQTINERIFTLPDETTILSGHGPKTTVAIEKKTNPFLQ